MPSYFAYSYEQQERVDVGTTSAALSALVQQVGSQQSWFAARSQQAESSSRLLQTPVSGKNNSTRLAASQSPASALPNAPAHSLSVAGRSRRGHSSSFLR